MAHIGQELRPGLIGGFGLLLGQAQGHIRLEVAELGLGRRTELGVDPDNRLDAL